MAYGKIVFVKQDAQGRPYGFVVDEAIKGNRPDLAVRFDTRCFTDSAAIAIGDRVEFQYQLDDRIEPHRMRFDSMKLATAEKEN